MSQKKRRTYMTFEQALEFVQWTHSDERRFQKQKELRAKQDAGMMNPMSLTESIRTVTKKELKEWLEMQYSKQQDTE